MSTLTLVELAQGITDEKIVELKGANGGWSKSSDIEEIFGFYNVFPDCVRIKPEPREYWIIPLVSHFGHMVSEVSPESRSRDDFLGGPYAFDETIHVREVIE